MLSSAIAVLQLINFMMKFNNFPCNFSPGLPGVKGNKGDLGPEGPTGRSIRGVQGRTGPKGSFNLNIYKISSKLKISKGLRASMASKDLMEETVFLENRVRFQQIFDL